MKHALSMSSVLNELLKLTRVVKLIGKNTVNMAVTFCSMEPCTVINVPHVALMPNGGQIIYIYIYILCIYILPIEVPSTSDLH